MIVNWCFHECTCQRGEESLSAVLFRGSIVIGTIAEFRGSIVHRASFDAEWWACEQELLRTNFFKWSIWMDAHADVPTIATRPVLHA